MGVHLLFPSFWVMVLQMCLCRVTGGQTLGQTGKTLSLLLEKYPTAYLIDIHLKEQCRRFKLTSCESSREKKKKIVQEMSRLLGNPSEHSWAELAGAPCDHTQCNPLLKG